MHNSIFVFSGSMRNTDATKSVTRSDLVWLCLAVDYIGKRLKTGEAKSNDFLSLVELGGKEKYLLKYQPVDWILYNRIIDFLRSCSLTIKVENALSSSYSSLTGRQVILVQTKKGANMSHAIVSHISHAGLAQDLR